MHFHFQESYHNKFKQTNKKEQWTLYLAAFACFMLKGKNQLNPLRDLKKKHFMNTHKKRTGKKMYIEKYKYQNNKFCKYLILQVTFLNPTKTNTRDQNGQNKTTGNLSFR